MPTRLAILTLTASNTGAWPANTTGTAVVQCTGAGGGGATNVGGGGGGAAAQKAFTPTPSAGWTATVGTGAIDTNGGDTDFDGICIAVGGKSRTNGGAGGLAASCTGDVAFSGADGAASTGNANGGGSAGVAQSGSGSNGGLPSGGRGDGSAAGGGGNSNASAANPGGRGRVRVFYSVTESTTYGFPRLVSATPSRFASSATSFDVALPGDIAGKLVTLLAASEEDAATLSIADTTWTKLGQSTSTNSFCTLAVFVKRMATNETTVTVAASASARLSHQILVHEDAGFPTATFNAGASTNPGPPTHSRQAGIAPCLWLAAVSQRNVAVWDVTAGPTGYDDLLIQPSGTNQNASLCSAQRRATLAIDRPTVFTSPVDTDWCGVTMAYAYELAIANDATRRLGHPRLHGRA